MIVFREKIFDGFIKGTQGVFTNSDWSLLLGGADELHLALIVLGVTGVNTAVRVEAQMSPDGTRWVVMGDALPSKQLSPPGGDLGFPVLFFSPLMPSLSHIRLQIVLTGTTPAGVFRLWATGRTPSMLST